jgi:hypothetical protein
MRRCRLRCWLEERRNRWLVWGGEEGENGRGRGGDRRACCHSLIALHCGRCSSSMFLLLFGKEVDILQRKEEGMMEVDGMGMGGMGWDGWT